MRPLPRLTFVAPLSALVVMLALAAQDRPIPDPMPPPGNPNHEDIAEGNFCHHPIEGHPDPAHDCACTPTCSLQDVDHDEDGNIDGQQYVRSESVMCRAWCHKTHCHCPDPCP
jgi:hypothetical protein